LSKTKHWRLVEIIKRGSGIVPVAEVLAEADPDLTSAEEGNPDLTSAEDEAEE
jgi:hypothetical protein